MTTSEKAKAYDEVLERAKNLLATSVAYDRFTIEKIFPELRESEDEKIRKGLIENFKWFCGDYPETSKWGKDDDLLVKDIIAWLEKQSEPQDKGEISDGYHTFNELYYYRMLYNAAFFNMLPKEWVHKSKKHHDGEDCFGGGWFIVMANLPTGQISNHYELKDWDLFQIPEKEVADKWDGHTPQEAADRLHKYLLEKQNENILIEEIKRRKELYSQEKEKAVSSTEKLSLGGRIAVLEELLVFIKEKQGEQKPILDFKASNWYVSKVDGKIHDLTYNPADNKPKFKVGDKLISTKSPHLTYEIIDIEDNELGELDYKVIIYTDGKDGVTHNISCKNVDAWGELVKEKPAWSEEDEAYLKQAIEEVGYALNDKNLIYTGNEDLIVWLKSLKERMGGK